MMQEIKANWSGDMTFEAEIDDHTIILDAYKATGGQNKGPNPKSLLLAALAGCTGMDVVALLKKMRVEIGGMEISIQGETSKEHPIYFQKIFIIYRFKSENINKEKVEKAISLSQERYCGVSYMLKQAAELSYEIIYQDEKEVA